MNRFWQQKQNKPKPNRGSFITPNTEKSDAARKNSAARVLAGVLDTEAKS